MTSASGFRANLSIKFSSSKELHYGIVSKWVNPLPLNDNIHTPEIKDLMKTL